MGRREDSAAAADRGKRDVKIKAASFLITAAHWAPNRPYRSNAHACGHGCDLEDGGTGLGDSVRIAEGGNSRADEIAFSLLLAQRGDWVDTSRGTGRPEAC